MPVLTNYSWYLGTPGNIETNPFSLLGIYGGPGNALANAVTTLETSTSDPGGMIFENTAGQTFSYDIGGGPVTQQLEQMNYYAVTYTLVDGTTGTAEMWVVQAVNGDTFALMDAGTDNDIMQSVGLRSLEFTSLIAPEYSWQPSYHAEAVAVCYVQGTRVRTPEGWCRVERLRAGDRVLSVDRGPRRLCWAGPTGTDTGQTPAIRFGSGCLGNQRPVLVSPQHRVLITHWMAELFFGSVEVLVPARAMLDGVAVTEANGPPRPYFHLMFERHELVCAEGAVMESLLLQDGSALALPREMRHAVGFQRLLRGRPYLMRSVRPVLSMKEGRFLAGRIRQEGGAAPACLTGEGSPATSRLDHRHAAL